MRGDDTDMSTNKLAGAQRPDPLASVFGDVKSVPVDPADPKTKGPLPSKQHELF